MEVYTRRTAFCYDHSSEIMAEDTGILDIFVHRARNIHNICIYNNQDVYAKFSFTCNPDETISTTIIAGGGKNPEFNESLRMKITHNEAVLKCEIWMLSRVRNFLEDQLLGFVLVPLLSLAGKGKVTQEFTLSSTDLFHSPAGTVKLTLFLATSPMLNSLLEPTNSSISSEVVLLHRNAADEIDPIDQYDGVEFPDMNIVTENYKMVSEYIDMAARENQPSSPHGRSDTASFLHLGAFAQGVGDYEMALISSQQCHDRSISVSPNASFLASSFGPTSTSMGNERNSDHSLERKSQQGTGDSSSSAGPSRSHEASPETPTSKEETLAADDSKDPSYQNKTEESSIQAKTGPFELATVFTAPLGNINIEAEQVVMQQHIVDMYMRSMQQFTESLARMKLPMDIDKPESDDNKNGVAPATENRTDEEKRKDGSRVFYGSRAFF